MAKKPCLDDQDDQVVPVWKPIQEAKPRKSAHSILLIRHGEYSKTSDDSTSVLTDRGKSQAKALGQRLQVLDEPIYAYCSTMMRAKETAKYLLSQLDNKIDAESNDLYREVCYSNVISPSFQEHEFFAVNLL